ncbi:hypothetical protein EJ08DRAFT_654443 [Tothia fuscella]|uniref:Uncharacterized protein n=1 Tax=Tothia fuscella TaxID=1048955 RepID=A0A9P4NEP7_9PEZI|nr:hypothetical protein EJ08DRAFT_654443 [Tothia fuscella]
MWDSANGKATTMVADLIIDRLDFKKRCGAHTKAHTMGDTGEMHICQVGLDSNLNSDIKCDNGRLVFGQNAFIADDIGT